MWLEGSGLYTSSGGWGGGETAAPGTGECLRGTQRVWLFRVLKTQLPSWNKACKAAVYPSLPSSAPVGSLCCAVSDPVENENAGRVAL